MDNFGILGFDIATDTAAGGRRGTCQGQRPPDDQRQNFVSDTTGCPARYFFCRSTAVENAIKSVDERRAALAGWISAVSA